MPLKLIKFPLDLAYYNASLILSLVPLGKTIVTLSEPWIMFTKPNVVLALAGAIIKFENYFLCLRIVCCVSQSTKHTSS